MRAGSKFSVLLLAGALCLTLTAQADTPATRRVHKAKKQPPPPLPSGPQGPVPQIPLDAIPAVPPQVTYQDGLLTIVAKNSSLGDILRGVRKYTSADIEIPPNANERVVTRLGPGPAREVVAELLNGSHFNYVLLGSPQDAKQLVRVVLVAKTGPDNPTPPATAAGENGGAAASANLQQPTETEAPDEPPDDSSPDQGTADADQQQPEQPGVKTPQQLLQEMQQRQLQMQQQQGQTGEQPAYPPPNGMPQSRPQPPPQEPQ